MLLTEQGSIGATLSYLLGNGIGIVIGGASNTFQLRDLVLRQSNCWSNQGLKVVNETGWINCSQ